MLNFARIRRLRRVLFDGEFYLQKYPDVAAAKMDPWRHYVKYGAREGRKPTPLFDPAYYLRCCPEARAGGQDPFLHFLKQRGRSCANPHPLFDCQAYVRAHPDAENMNPLEHHFRAGKRGPAPAAKGGQFGCGT